MSAARQPILVSTITCPVCGKRKTEAMPVDACLYFYECEGCAALLLPMLAFPLFFYMAFAGGLSAVGSLPGFD